MVGDDLDLRKEQFYRGLGLDLRALDRLVQSAEELGAGFGNLFYGVSADIYIDGTPFSQTALKHAGLFGDTKDAGIGVGNLF